MSVSLNIDDKTKDSGTGFSQLYEKCSEKFEALSNVEGLKEVDVLEAYFSILDGFNQRESNINSRQQ